MSPSARRGPWSTAEDSYLLSIVAQQGPHNWVRISQLVRTRTPKQCRERFHQNLKPTLNHEPITAEEGELIERLVNEMGKKWAEIARQLNGRSDNAVKNWWNGGQNRRRRMSDRRRSSDQHSHSAAAQAQQHLDPYYPQHQLHHHHHHHHHHALPVALEHQPAYAQAPAYHAAAPANRPSPLTIQPHPAYGTRPYDTPMPSPSSQSIMSTEGAPSLVTDNGSETRSPHYAASPMEHGHSLPPLIGRRDERRRSSVLFLPRDASFVTEDEAALMHQQQHDKLQQRDCRRLPEPAGYSPRGQASPAFREPNYAASRQMPHLTQPLESAAASPSAFPHQRQLPSFHTLTADVGRVPYLPPVESRYPSPPQSFSHERPRSPPSASKPSNLASLLN